MPKGKRTLEELKTALEIQQEAITGSCQAYDDGKTWEALRIAVSIYTVVHDSGKRNKSILTQIGSKDKIRFLASGESIAGKNVFNSSPLVGVRVYGKRLIPLLPVRSTFGS